MTKKKDDGRTPLQYRVMNSLQLVRLTKNAAARHYNQYPQLTWLQENLDPNGTHLITMAIPHNDGDHLRAVVLVKRKDSMVPVEMLLDMTWESYNKLDTVDAIENTAQDTIDD